MEAARIEPAEPNMKSDAMSELTTKEVLAAANALHSEGSDWRDMSLIDTELKDIINN